MAWLHGVLRDTPVPLAERDAQLLTGQVRAKAAVDPTAEREMTIDVAVSLTSSPSPNSTSSVLAAPSRTRHAGPS